MSGIIRRRPDQRYDPPAAPLAPSTAAGVFRGRLVIVSGTAAGVFVYNGEPGRGNPPVSWMTTATADPFGNPVDPSLGLSGLPLLAYAGLSGQVQQTFTSSGTWTAPAGVSSVLAQCWGPGGAGASSSGALGAAGGGGGEYAAEPVLAVTAGNTYSLTVAAGSATVFPGDSVTVTAHAGAAGSGTSPGAGGTGSVNTAHHSGGAGSVVIGSPGGGGGAGAGPLAAGGNASGAAGGAAPSGGGAGGGGGVTGNGSAGGSPGGGGGGGAGGTHSGGAGGGGQVTLLYSSSSLMQLLAAVAGTAGSDSSGNTWGPGFRLLSQQWLIPSGDLTGATDSANLAAALAAADLVILLPGTWYVDQPVVIPDQKGLACGLPSWATPSGNYGAGGLPLEGAIITPVAGFAGAAVISMGSAGTTQHGGQRITGITIDGSDLPAGNTVNGIESTGFVGGVKIRDTVVWGNYNSGTTKGLGGRGLYAHNDGTSGHNPDFWQVDGCHFSQCGIAGAELVALADSWITNSEAVGNNGDGWRITNGSGSRYIGCRGDSNSNGTGWALTGGAGFTGSLQFTNIEANLDNTGLAISGTGTGTYYLSLFKSTGNTANYSYAGTMNVKSDAAYNTSTAAPTLS